LNPKSKSINKNTYEILSSHKFYLEGKIEFFNNKLNHILGKEKTLSSLTKSLLIKIYLFLPYKYIYIFQIVCKNWHNIFSKFPNIKILERPFVFDFFAVQEEFQ